MTALAERPIVHAIVVHHRGRAMLNRCLRSLLASQGVALEVVVVANGCDEALPELVAESPEVHLVATPPIGFAPANNLGVAFARDSLGDPTSYYFLNNDTESDPDALSRLQAALDEHPAAAVAGPRLDILGAPEYLNSLGSNLTRDAWGWDEGIGIAAADYGPLPGRREVLSVTGSALLVEAEMFERIGGWCSLYGWYFEDNDLCLRVWRAGGTVVNVPDARVRHQISATMTEGSERKEHYFWRNRLLLAIVHWPPRLLAGVFRRAVVDEIWKTERKHNGLQRRALWGALRRLRMAWRERRRVPRDRPASSWTGFLHPVGSVPVIRLPEADEEGAGPAGDGPGDEVVAVGTEPRRGSPLAPSPAADELDAQLRAERERVADLTAELEAIRGSKMWRAWMRYHALRRALLRPFRRR